MPSPRGVLHPRKIPAYSPHGGHRGPHFRGSRTPCHPQPNAHKSLSSQQPQHAATTVCCPGASGPPCVARRVITYPISCSGALTDGRAAAQARAHGGAGAPQRHARGRRARGAVRARGLPRAARGRAHAVKGKSPWPFTTRPRRRGGRVPRALLGRAAAGRRVRRTASLSSHGMTHEKHAGSPSPTSRSPPRRSTRSPARYLRQR